MAGHPEIEVTHDAEGVATRVAFTLLERIAAAQEQGRVPHIVLTGGTIAEKVHRAAARATEETPTAVDWSLVEIWWGDERYVPTGDEQRNAGQARRALLDHVAVDPARVHEMPASDAGYPDLESAAAAYGEELAAGGPDSFDVVMLGIGPDGHVASLFPGFPQLDVEDRSTVPVHDSPKPPPNRISLTYPVLNRTSEVWFLVTSEEKADPAARAIGGADRHELPAAGVHGRDRTIWFLDEAAASKIRR